MITIGINENVKISKETKFNEEKGWFSLVLTSSEGNLLDAFNEGIMDEGTTINIFCPNVKDWQQAPKSGMDIVKDIMAIKRQFQDILSTMLTADKVAEALKVQNYLQVPGINLKDSSTILSSVTNEETLKTIFKNLCEAFLKAVTPHMEKAEMRMMLRRASKKRAFPALYPVGKYPVTWVEPMTVPADQSTIAFSDYDIKNGLNSAAAISNDDTATADDVFAASAGEEVSDPFAAMPK